MKFKGFFKLSVQIAVLSISMLVVSLFTDTQFWLDHFNFPIEAGQCHYGDHNNHHEYQFHYHWNYRGWIYFLTGLCYFGIAVARIALSHKEEDFRKT